ncbi:MAG: sodium-dependent transporter, partial [Planctomycetota bacterium]
MADTEQAEAGGGAATRERWPGRFSFIMAAIGSAVGLGNVWGFPKVAYANGGGAFFIPYFVALLTAGIPLLILEFSVGQMMQGSAPKALRKLNKNFEWVGWFALLVASVISVYYAVIMAYSWNYLYDSISVAMPWSAGGEGTEESYFYDTFLQRTTAAGVWWHVRWPIVLGLAATWVSVFLIIYKGVHRVGKIVLVTVPLPWVILCILTIRGLTLEGASAGVEYYLRPDFEKLKDPATWLAAYGQIFFSLTIGFGVMIAYASYRPRKSDVTNSAFIVSFANCMTSFIAGFAVFSVLGFLAFKKGVPVEDVVAGGPGLAFVAYPAAITKMGDLGAIWPPLIGILFFTTLLSLGIDSLFSLVEALGAGFHDHFPKVKRVHLTAAFCTGGFLLGIFFCMRGGLGFVDLFDYWTNKYGLVLVGLLQCVLVGYFYSSHRIRDFADDVSEVKLRGWWELCVKVITPVVLVYLLSNALVKEFTTAYGASDWPEWMLWVARLGFVLLFAAAFSITRRWTYVALAAIALVVGLVTYGIVRPASAVPEATVALVTSAPGGADGTYKADFRANFSGGADAAASWDFGDGASSAELNPSHTYAKPGTYKVKL